MARILTILITLIICSISSGKTIALEPSKGDALLQEGTYWLQQGRYRDAISVFRAARQAYLTNKQERFADGVYTYISQAQHRLAQPNNACRSLLLVLNFHSDICKTHIKIEFKDKKFQKLPRDLITISALQHLAIVSRTLGKNEQSLELLENTITISEELGDSQVLPVLQLTQAHTLQAILTDAIENRKHIDFEHITKSETYYVDLSQRLLRLLNSLSNADNADLALRGSISWLSAYELIIGIPNVALASISDNLQTEAQRRTAEVINTGFDSLRGADGVRARQKFVSILLEAENTNSEYLEIAHKLNHESYKIADQLKSKYLRSLSLGNLGLTEYRRGNTDISLQYLIDARNLAIAHFLPGLAYKWDWELGKIYASNGDKEKAIISYKSSLASLQETRGNLLTNPLALRSSFRKSVEPIYEEYLRLLLEDSNQNLEEVVRVFEEFQQLAIENYLRCGRLNFSSVRSDPKHKTVFYYIDLNTEYHVVVKANDNLYYFQPDISKIREESINLNAVMQKSGYQNATEWAFQEHTQALYDELIRPVEHLLVAGDEITYISTGLMETIPLGMLYDGSQYLIQSHPVTASLGSQLVFHNTKDQQRSTIAGVGNSPLFSQLGLSQLPSVYIEVRQLSSSQKSTTIIDSQFKLSTLRKQLAKGLSSLHIATHGQFSSNPERTFLLAWDRPIKSRQFDALLYDRIATKRSPIDLLFLSACETATGDHRARLGLAGLAVQAGARSTIASLWQVKDRSTSELAVEFYRGFNQGLSKAEALQQAQLKLLDSDEYYHPYYWAAFILVGDGV